MWPSICECPTLEDRRLGRLARVSPSSDPLHHAGEHLAKVQVDRRHSRHDHGLRPPLRELPLENRQGKFGSNVDLAREGRDHPGFKICLGLPNEPLEGLVRLALPPHPMAQRLRGHPGQLRRGFSIASTADRVKDDGGAVIGQFCLPATAPALSGQLDRWKILPSDSWALLCWPAWPSTPSAAHSVHLPSLSGRKLFSHCTSVFMTAIPNRRGLFSPHCFLASNAPLSGVLGWMCSSMRLPKEAGHAEYRSIYRQKDELANRD